MRNLTLILSALLLTLIATRVTAMEEKPKVQHAVTCRIATGYGTAIGSGHSLSEAREKARLVCGTSLIDQYFAQRRNIPDDVKEDLALACVNKECQ